MTNSKDYNGFKNYAQWNQSLWINNDEGLYNQARECIRATTNRKQAAELFILSLQDQDMTHTPDGIKWSVAGVRAGMVGL
jgi:hypothetical protein